MTDPHFDLLIEAEQMRTILSSLKELSAQSEGVVVNGEVISWDEALPLLNTYPDFDATREQKKEWMALAAYNWEKDYLSYVKNLVTETISKHSTLENDNLYLWSLLNGSRKILNCFIHNGKATPHTSADPQTLTAAKDLLVAIEAVINGTQHTGTISNEIYLSGIDTVAMEFKMLYTIARKENRLEDAAIYSSVLVIIEKIKTELPKLF